MCCKSLTLELNRGLKHSHNLARHLAAMGGNSATIPVTFEGDSCTVKIERHPPGARKTNRKPNP